MISNRQYQVLVVTHTYGNSAFICLTITPNSSSKHLTLNLQKKLTKKSGEEVYIGLHRYYRVRYYFWEQYYVLAHSLIILIVNADRQLQYVLFPFQMTPMCQSGHNIKSLYLVSEACDVIGVGYHHHHHHHHYINLIF